MFDLKRYIKRIVSPIQAKSFKVGQKVIVRDLMDSNIQEDLAAFDSRMKDYCGSIFIIRKIDIYPDNSSVIYLKTLDDRYIPYIWLPEWLEIWE